MPDAGAACILVLSPLALAGGALLLVWLCDRQAARHLPTNTPKRGGEEDV